MSATTISSNGITELEAAPPAEEEAPADEQMTFRLRRLAKQRFIVPIRGTAPLIVNRWSEKARAQMLESQQTKAKPKKDAKNPKAEFEASRYYLADNRDGFPAAGFKASIVHAARLFDKSLTQVILKQSITVGGEMSRDAKEKLVPIVGDVLMREDTPRAQGTAQLRYRAQFWPWEATLHIICVEGQFDEESILALVDAGGIGGVGEWRPASPKSATGTYGTFEVVSE